jgi:hypothetical protein
MMSERTLIAVSVALGLVTLYISYRMAVGLSQLKADADKTISDVKASPAGQFLSFLGLK